MFSLLVLAASGVRAAFYGHEQIPLRVPSRSDVIVPLTLDQNLHYTFPLPDKDGDVALQDVNTFGRTGMASISTLIIDIPLATADPGSITLSHNASTLLDGVFWLQSSSHIELDNVGIRKGGMITMPATSATLSLGTPFISLPDSLFYVLLQAANTSPEQKFVVNCEAVLILPDLVFGLFVDEEDDGDLEPEELIVTPQQYVMADENGKCMLLARSAGEGPIEMGWAAIRGRQSVLNLAAGRIGFGIGI